MAQILFTARPGGTSVTPFDSFNLGDHVGDASKSVEDNRQVLQSLLSNSKLKFMNQVHGNEVVEVLGDEGGAGPQFSQGDGGDVLRKNGRGEGIGLRRRQEGGVRGVGKISGPGVCRNEKQAEGECFPPVVVY